MTEITDRVRAHTSTEQLEKIDCEISNRIRFYANQPREKISERIAELEREWDMERWLEANASTLALTGVVLGTVSRKWLWLSGTVLSFLLMHAIQGWCPPVPAMRRLGVRTQREIDAELYALKLLRGDADDFLGEHPKHTRNTVDSLTRAFAPA